MDSIQRLKALKAKIAAGGKLSPEDSQFLREIVAQQQQLKPLPARAVAVAKRHGLV